MTKELAGEIIGVIAPSELIAYLTIGRRATLAEPDREQPRSQIQVTPSECQHLAAATRRRPNDRK